MNCTHSIKNGKEYLKFKDIIVNIEIEDMSFYFYDLFKNNPDLTKRMNEAFYENRKALYEEFQPIISKAIEAVVLSTVQRVFDTFPLDILMPV